MALLEYIQTVDKGNLSDTAWLHIKNVSVLFKFRNYIPVDFWRSMSSFKSRLVSPVDSIEDVGDF